MNIYSIACAVALAFMSFLFAWGERKKDELLQVVSMVVGAVLLVVLVGIAGQGEWNKPGERSSGAQHCTEVSVGDEALVVCVHKKEEKNDKNRNF